jgi:Protein of unknown function (DUF2924)
MDAEIAAKITKLPSWSKTELRSLWQANFGEPAPANLRKGLMMPMLAISIQEKAFGGMSPGNRKRLQKIAQSVGTTAPRRKSSRLQPGTRLVRSWQGVLHQVTVLVVLSMPGTCATQAPSDDSHEYHIEVTGHASARGSERSPQQLSAKNFAVSQNGHQYPVRVFQPLATKETRGQG